MARAIYVVVDTSGSTVRGGFDAACTQALPLLVDAAGSHADTMFSLLSYGSSAQVLIRLSAPADVRLIPPLVRGGLSSLAAGMQLLARCIDDDSGQLAADGIGWRPPIAFILADGLPTDTDDDLIAARSALDAGRAGQAPEVHAALPGDTGRLSLMGLRMTPHELAPGTPADCAASILSAFETAVNT